MTDFLSAFQRFPNRLSQKEAAKAKGCSAGDRKEAQGRGQEDKTGSKRKRQEFVPFLQAHTGITEPRGQR
jgi:hypothetical protein